MSRRVGLAADLAKLPADQQAAFLASLSEEDAKALEYDWTFWARPNQLAPEGEWTTWLLLAGRGFGKSRTGAEWVRQQKNRMSRIALVGPTAADVRDIMVEGESGILAASPSWDRPEYEPSKRRLTWANGAIATTYSADEPDRLRGPQHEAAWCDEIATWRYPEAWDMLMFGLRLGDRPRVVATTTPKPVKLVREILTDPDTVVTRGSTYDNRANLAPSFLRKIVRKYEGTRLGRQELNAELLDDIPGALLPRALIDAVRLTRLPDDLPPTHSPAWHQALAERLGLVRICVAVDPSGADDEQDEKADEIGIVAAGIDRQQRAYVLEDASGTYSPEGWGRKTIELFDRWRADRIVAERNFGGGMVAANIRAVRSTAPVEVVTASRGKVQRFEPVAALYEQGRVIHVGSLPALEDQMVAFTRTGYQGAGSPDRADAAIWALSDLLLGEETPYDLLGAVGPEATYGYGV